MIASFGLLTIIILSIIVVRIGATALELTGLSPEIAGFQSQSAFSGVGFTTAESESIVSHPVRRRIVRILILLGSAGIPTTIATFVLTFIGQPGEKLVNRAITLIFGLLVILLFARSKYIYKVMKRIIKVALKKWTTMRVYDYAQILGFGEGYSISRIAVRSDSWLSNRKLKDLKLDLEDILILSIYRKEDEREKFIGAPHGDTVIKAGDALICYAKHEIGEQLAQRSKGTKGNKEHKEIVEET